MLRCPTSLRRVRALAARAREDQDYQRRRRKRPRVLAVYTGEDLAAAKVGGLPCGWLITDVNGKPMKEPPYPPRAGQGAPRRRARRGGDRRTLEQARDAAERSRSTTTYSPPWSSPKARSEHPIHDIARTTPATSGRWATRPPSTLLQKAAHVTKLEFWNNRLVPNAIEPRAANATYSRADDSYTLYVASRTRTSSGC